MREPELVSSSREERLAYVRERFRCIADCDQCGLCHLFRGASPEVALADYIEGKRELRAVLRDCRRR